LPSHFIARLFSPVPALTDKPTETPRDETIPSTAGAVPGQVLPTVI
jgi:hypothetical protein